MKKVLKIIGSLLLIVALLLGGLLGYLSFTEFKPDDVEEVEVSKGNKTIKLEDELSFMIFNIGYAGLGENEDFFMDGGKQVQPDNKEIVEEYLEGIKNTLQEENADFYLLQELDIDSKRTYNINQKEYLENELNLSGMFAYNFKCEYVPYPFPTIGKVGSGVLTMSDYTASSASRISLPVPFSWPVSMANLKRCILETRYSIEGSDKELVILNFHLEAYDDGEGKAKQTQVMVNKIVEEYQKGNYVVAGGDFNQTTEESLEKYPIKNSDNWTPGNFDVDAIPEGFSLLMDNTVSTSRLNDAPYSDKSQLYVIDGYIISPNIELISLNTIDKNYKDSDHNPVSLKIKLK